MYNIENRLIQHHIPKLIALVSDHAIGLPISGLVGFLAYVVHKKVLKLRKKAQITYIHG